MTLLNHTPVFSIFYYKETFKEKYFNYVNQNLLKFKEVYHGINRVYEIYCLGLY